MGKFYVFQAAIQGGALPLVIVGVISSAILAFPYVRVIVLMFFSEPATEGPVVVRPSAYTGLAVAIGAAATVVLGIIPEPLISLAKLSRRQPPVRPLSLPEDMQWSAPTTAIGISWGRLENSLSYEWPAGSPGKPMRGPT